MTVLRFAAVLLLTSCGPKIGPVSPRAETEPRRIEACVTFDARSPTPTGASRLRRPKAARLIGVRVLDGEGEPIAVGVTDQEGCFAIDATTAAHHLELVSQVKVAPHDLMVSIDGVGAEPHRLRLPIPEPGATIHVPDEQSMAGALHILDAMLRGTDAVKGWVGVDLPPFFAYWGRGQTTEWSFYTGERPAGSGRYTIELLGGEANQQFTTDTDEHDETIVLHEFGHFVFDVLTTDSSHGGGHPRGFLLDPGLAWEEGRATFFAAAVMRHPKYLDTIGVEPHGSLRVHHDLERGAHDEPHGIGSEAGVAEILWDLADGAGELPDSDRDGVALGPAGVIEAMRALREVEGAYPSVATFLRFLVKSGRVSEAAMKRVLVVGGHPHDMLPEDDVSLWPSDLQLPTTVSGKIDSVSNPAPSGGPPHPVNGLDAVDVYRFRLEAATDVVIELKILGSGAPADHSDLDLELRDLRAELVDGARGTGPREVIRRRLEPGWYVLYVRDGGNGTKASYELQVAAGH